MTDPNFHISTPRLYISYFLSTSSEHCQFLHNLYNTPLFISLEGQTSITSPDKAKEKLEEFARNQAKYGYGQYLVSLKPSPNVSFSSSKPIGSVSLMRGNDPDSPSAPDIGFAIMPEHNGKGYATEAAKALLEYARQSLGVNEVLGFGDPKNPASRRVMEKIGMEEREIRAMKVFGGAESVIYVLPGMKEDLRAYGIS